MSNDNVKLPLWKVYGDGNQIFVTNEECAKELADSIEGGKYEFTMAITPLEYAMMKEGEP